jgi:hypothetical protein
MSTEPASLLHYNDCEADSGAPCTCEPRLTTVEEVAAVLFACHEIEYIDAETGWACGCDEDGYLVLQNEADARKHQAEATLAALTPLIAAETLDEYADRMYLHSEEAALNDATEGSVSGIWAAANTLRKWASALRTTTPEHKGDPR